MTVLCFCGCGARAEDRHHCLYEQDLRRAYRSTRPAAVRGGLEKDPAWLELTYDPRNLVSVSRRCHSNHHSRARPYHLPMLPDSVFEFAAEVLGAGRAYNWLRRHYNGEDPRLDALLVVESREEAA